MLLHDSERAGGSGLPRLTAREREVLQHIAAGFRSRAIAMKLQVSEKTVATHRMRLTKKIGIREPHELVSYARQYFSMHAE